MAEETSVYIRRESRFGRLRSVVTEWAEMQLQYARTHPEDRVYFYTEQANCALLSAAAWKQGYPSLAEFQHTKRHPSDRRINVNGRIDLYIWRDQSYYFEAKKIVVNLQKSLKSESPENLKTAIERGLAAVRKSAGDTHPAVRTLHKSPDFSDYVMGEILFVVPRLANRHADLVGGAREMFISALAEIDDAEVVAWSLPAGEEDVDLGEHRHLGIAMLMRTYATSLA